MSLRPKTVRDRVSAGVRNRVIRLERHGVTYDQWHQPTEGWSPLAEVWASKEDVSDAEKMRAAQVGSSLTARFGIAYDDLVATLTTADRLICDGKTYDISGVKELGTREGIEITAARPSDNLTVDMTP